MPSEPPMLTENDVRPKRGKRQPTVTNVLDPIAARLRDGAVITINEASSYIGDGETDTGKNTATRRLLRGDSRFHVFMEDGTWRVVLARIAEQNPVRFGQVDNGADVPPPDLDPAIAGGPTLDELEAIPDSLDVPTLGDRLATAQAIAGDAPVATALAEPISKEAVISTAPAEPVTVEDGLRAEIQRLKDELTGYRARVEREAEAVQVIKDTEEEVESAKKVLSGKKAELANAYLELRKIVSGDAAQQELAFEGEDEDDGSPTVDEFFGIDKRSVDREKAEQSRRLTASIPELAGRLGALMRRLSLPDAQAHLIRDVPGLTAEALAQGRNGCTHLAPAEKPLQVQGVQAYERAWIVADAWEGGPWLLLPLYSKDEWAQLHESEYGRCVTGFDQNDEARERRQLGGMFNGLVVKQGRKLLVVGPQKDALVFVPNPTAAERAEVSDRTATFDAKAAAAGEKPE